MQFELIFAILAQQIDQLYPQQLTCDVFAPPDAGEYHSDYYICVFEVFGLFHALLSGCLVRFVVPD